MNAIDNQAIFQVYNQVRNQVYMQVREQSKKSLTFR
jgi:hypothetical protein